jgi:hypothetical protein
MEGVFIIRDLGMLKIAYFALQVLLAHPIECFPLHAHLIDYAAQCPDVSLLIKRVSSTHFRGAVVECPYLLVDKLIVLR